MPRVLDIWRAWSVRQRVARGGRLLAAGGRGALAAYLILKRPGDVSNPDAAFQKKHAQPQAKQVKTVNWPVYGYDDERTRYLPSKRVNPPFHSSDWSWQAGQLLEFSPIVVDGTLYVIDKDAPLLRTRRPERQGASGSTTSGSLAASSPAYSHGHLYRDDAVPGPGDGDAHQGREDALEAAAPGPHRDLPARLRRQGDRRLRVRAPSSRSTGHGQGRLEASTRRARSRAASPPQRRRSSSATTPAQLYAVQASNGAVKWQTETQGGGFRRGGGIYSTPAVAFGRVYVGSLDGRVYSYEESTGELAWSHSTGAEVYPAPAVADAPGHRPRACTSARGPPLLRARRPRRLDSLGGAHSGGVVLGAASVVGRDVYVGVIGPNDGHHRLPGPRPASSSSSSTSASTTR